MSFLAPDLPVIYLKAGEIRFSEKPVVIMTVLGSCLSVTMFHRSTGTGAICHGLMPGCGRQAECTVECADASRHVTCSIRRMVRQLDRLRIRRSEVEVKCFGGADMLGAAQNARPAASVGRQNIAAAQAVLTQEGFILVAKDVGGAVGRKIFFNTLTGEVLLKRLQPNIILADDGRCK